MINEQSFTFNNRPQTLGAFTQQLFAFLNTQLSNWPAYEDLFLRAKFIIGELLNNAVKHSGVNETVFHISFKSDSLLITKHDTGQPWHLLTQTSATHGLPLIISTDDIHQLYAVNEGLITRFYYQETDFDGADLVNLQEHLGLLIITKAADEFTYQYQVPVNIFTATIKLG